MDLVLGILLAAALIAALFFGAQVAGARAGAARATREMESMKDRLGKLEVESKKSGESLDAKRRENEELKERLKDAKRKRQEEQEAGRLRKDIQEVREQVEREMEKKLAQAREEAEASKSAVKKLIAEVEALKARKPTPAPLAAPTQEPRIAEKPAEEKLPPAARPLKDEERARLELAEKGLAKAKARLEELEAEVKRFKGRTETDRRVFIVQKGELDLARDRFRTLESRYNELVLERDELAKQVWTLDKQMKALRPTADPVGPAEKKPEGPESAAETKSAAATVGTPEPVPEARPEPAAKA